MMTPHLPAHLSGKTVLDLDGNAGYFSIQMEFRGASRCILVEPFEEFVAQARFATRQFGVEIEIVNDDAHAFCLTTEERFDYVLFLGLFYHLKYPVLVLDRAAEMTRERLFLVSNVIATPTTTCSKIRPFPRWRSSRRATTETPPTGDCPTIPAFQPCCEVPGCASLHVLIPTC
jgi:2-polyprenyl-3-methyl-5-hydroxy-6-metoxy-1,4-benzoquinol methylase